MRDITEFPQFRTEVVHRNTLHIFGLGFEERCLKFPQILKDSRPSAGSQIFFCIDPGDRNLAYSLKAQRDTYAREIQQMLPSARICTLEEPLTEIGSRENPDFYCIDCLLFTEDLHLQDTRVDFQKNCRQSPYVCGLHLPKDIRIRAAARSRFRDESRVRDPRAGARQKGNDGYVARI